MYYRNHKSLFILSTISDGLTALGMYYREPQVSSYYLPYLMDSQLWVCITGNHKSFSSYYLPYLMDSRLWVCITGNHKSLFILSTISDGLTALGMYYSEPQVFLFILSTISDGLTALGMYYREPQVSLHIIYHI